MTQGKDNTAIYIILGVFVVLIMIVLVVVLVMTSKKDTTTPTPQTLATATQAPSLGFDMSWLNGALTKSYNTSGLLTSENLQAAGKLFV